jgi:tetratricopeptide (TPR) repeat protein
MAELEIYEKFGEIGEKIIAELKNMNLDKFEEYAEEGWGLFPESVPKKEGIIKHEYIKMIFEGHLDKKNFELAKKWLDRLVKNNEKIHFHRSKEVWFCTGQYFFETGNKDEAYKQWQKIVEYKKNRCEDDYFKDYEDYSCFENKDPKYLDFYAMMNMYQRIKGYEKELVNK